MLMKNTFSSRLWRGSASVLSSTPTKGRQFSCTSSLSARQHRLPAAYYRGGTSRAVFFQHKDLPSDKRKWDDIFLGVIGSPDPNGRQLNGMGGGVSSLSKVC